MLFILFSITNCNGIQDETVELKILSYNLWGLPHIYNSKYKSERISAFANKMKYRQPKFDILLLNELWMQHDHSLIQKAAQEAGLYMTEFRQLASSWCDGRVAPTTCSGLAVLSVFPFKQIQFTRFDYRGWFLSYEWFTG